MNNLAIPLESFEYERDSILTFFNNSYANVLLQHREVANHIGSFNIKQEFLEQSFPKLCSSIKTTLVPNDIFFARFFVTLPNAKGDIHIDTKQGSPTLFRELTLNIPLIGCTGAYHEWYDTHDVPYTEFKHSALYWRNYNSGTLIDSYELTVPTILKVSVPHRIYNQLNSYRVVLSVRTESDKFNPAVESILEVV